MKQPGNPNSSELVFWFYFAAILGLGGLSWWYTMSIPKSPLPIKEIQTLRLNNEDLSIERPKSGYHLTFTIGYQSQKSHNFDIKRLFEEHFEPALSSRAYFRIDFVEKYHVAPFVPLPEDRNIGEEDLRVFVNGMGIEDGDEDPMRQLTPINFVFYVPEKPSLNDALAFVYPKWGGVYIHSSLEKETLEEAFQVFAFQLRNGIRVGLELPLGKAVDVCVAHAVDSLQSLISTLHASPNIPIGPMIADQVRLSLKYLKVALDASRDLEVRYVNAVLAAEWAEKAFFHPSMLASQYFPDEHKMAVYFPVIIPALVPLISALKAKLFPKK